MMYNLEFAISDFELCQNIDKFCNIEIKCKGYFLTCFFFTIIIMKFAEEYTHVIFFFTKNWNNQNLKFQLSMPFENITLLAY